MTTLKIVWTTIKKYWKIILLVLGGIIGLIFLRFSKTSFIDDFNKIRNVHKKEIDKIELIRKQEQEQNEQNEKLLAKRLEQVHKEYDKEKQELNSEKAKEVELLAKKYKDDPDELAKKLSEVTGFKIIFPAEEHE